MGLYHVNIGIPKRICYNWGILTLEYDVMAPYLEQKFGPLPKTLDTDSATLVEIEDDKFGFPYKVTYRVSSVPDVLDALITIIPCVDVSESLAVGIVKHFTLIRCTTQLTPSPDKEYDIP